MDGARRTKKLIGAREAATLVGLDVATIRRLARSGELPSTQVGNQWRFDPRALERWKTQADRRRTAPPKTRADAEPRAVETSAFPVVGIGTSAGGLEALELFFHDVPRDSGVAFVVVQHLDPTHEGMLVELLQRTVPIAVVQAAERMPVLPNHIYVIPPNHDLSIRSGVLHLHAPTTARGHRLPIDFFFRELGADRQHRAIAVVLSVSSPPSTAETLLEHAREALLGTQRIRDVVRGLGSFIAVERAERTRVDVAQALTAAIGMALNELRHRARLITDFGGTAEVWAAKGTLSQVFLNLLINATHAIEDGDHRDARITVRTWTDVGSSYVEIGDTGHGIAPENLSRVFEPFFTTKVAGKGSGLGLAISRELILELGGDITVASVIGEGTRFVVRLPICAPVDVVPAAAIPHPHPQPKARGRVLVVDDEPGIRAVLRRVLALHEVVLAASGAEAQAILEQDSAFDVVLCDVMMPGMTGVELHMWLLARDPVLAARTVFITGGTFTPSTSEYLARVGNERIDMPFDTAFVQLLIDELVRRHVP